MANPNDFIVQPVNALGAYLGGVQARQGMVEGENRNALLKMQQELAAKQGQRAEQQYTQEQQKEIADILTNGVQWADTPEKWAQLQAYAKQRGYPAEQYGFDQREVILNQMQQKAPALMNVAPGGALVDPRNPTQPVYQAPFKPEAPPAPPAPPSGFRANPDGSLAPIPGGPADPATISAKPTPLSAEVKNKLGQLDVAERAAKEYASLVLGPDGEFDEVRARMPAASRILKNAIRAKLRAESGATITAEEVDGEMERYGPALLSSGATNAAATKRLLDDLALTRQTLSQEPVVQPSAAPGKVRKYNPATGKIE